MTDAAIIAICAAVPLITGQIIQLFLSSRNAAKLNEVATKVDGTASASQAREEALQKEVASLRQSLAERKETASLLAQSVAQALPTPASEVKVVNTPSDPVPTTAYSQ